MDVHTSSHVMVEILSGAIGLLAIAFIAWAGVVWNATKRVQLMLEQIRKDLEEDMQHHVNDFNDYRIKTESRLAKVEARVFNGGAK